MTCLYDEGIIYKYTYIQFIILMFYNEPLYYLYESVFKIAYVFVKFLYSLGVCPVLFLKKIGK